LAAHLALRTILPGALLVLSLAPALADDADTERPVLMVLEHVENGKRITTPVEAKRGAALSPARGRAHEKWTIRPGTVFNTAARPGDVVVELYRGADKERIHVGTVGIRYFRDKRGVWVPRFQLSQEPLLVRDKDGWKPLTSLRGAPSLIVITSSTLPNAEGFYPALEFGLTTGRMQIDSWVVK
jgi:hypothetical protein